MMMMMISISPSLLFIHVWETDVVPHTANNSANIFWLAVTFFVIIVNTLQMNNLRACVT